jgi:hypothetical protein
MPTPKEITAEIKALEECKGYIPHHTAFGEDNHAFVDTQIAVLRGEIDHEDDSTEEWEERPEREQNAIIEARDWLTGDSDESPSSGWANYKPKKK